MYIVPITYGLDIKELGQSICDQEYNMDYASYSTKEGLECKPKILENKTSYDGIKIKIRGE